MRKNKSLLRKILGLFWVLCLCMCHYALCQEVAQPKKITRIEVKGNKTVSQDAILTKLRTRVGADFEQTLLNEDLKRLYATGLFSDVSVSLQDYEAGVSVLFNVSEKPLLKDIIFEGNRVIKKEKFQDTIKSKKGEFLDKRQLKIDMDQLTDLYRQKGYSLVKLNYEVELNENTNEATVFILIDEGIRIAIKDILLEGNKHFSDRQLLKLIKTRKGGFFSKGLYKDEVLEEDLKRIKSFYNEEGFSDAKVSKEITYDKTGKRMFIKINIEEGKKYLVGDINIKGAALFEKSYIKGKLEMLASSTFSRDKMHHEIAIIQGLYFERGYINAIAKADTLLNPQAGKIDITYTIEENELVYVHKIRITGNTKTRDKVIRRQLRLKPGEPFDGVALRRSKERLYNLGFFEEIIFDNEPIAEKDKHDLVVSVKEAKTGEFSFGGGFSSIDRAIGFVEIEQRNFDISNWPTFTGAGQDMKFRFEFGTARRDFELSFTEPWMFDRPTSFGFDLFNKVRLRERSLGLGFDEERRGGDVRLGREFSDTLKGNLTYRLEGIDISNIAEEASSDLKNEAGKNTLSSMIFGISKDTRDSVFNPTSGMLLSDSVEIAGGLFGGDKDFVKTILGTSWYFTPREEFVLELRLRAGVVDSFGESKNVPIYERFFAGGANTIRGYRERRVGPRDAASNDPIGGESMFLAGAEWTFPVVQYLKGAIFYDTGNVWRRVNDFGDGKFKHGVGVGIRVNTPIGPVRLDFGYPLVVDKDEERTGRFHFSLSRGF